MLEEYKNYYDWLTNVIQKDISNIQSKKMKYLYQTFTQLAKNVETDLNICNQSDKICLINKQPLYAEKLSDFLKKTKREYNQINQCKDKDYSYYDGLSSWYHIKVELTASIICKLSKNILASNADLKGEWDMDLDELVLYLQKLQSKGMGKYKMITNEVNYNMANGGHYWIDENTTLYESEIEVNEDNQTISVSLYNEYYRY